MKAKIIEFVREYILIFSIIAIIIGLILIPMGIIWYFLTEISLGFYTDLIYQLENWNFYLIILGLVILPTGLYYLYLFFKNKKFILEEISTNKRSELLKRQKELRRIVKKMPKKYRKMLKEKEQELNIK